MGVEPVGKRREVEPLGRIADPVGRGAEFPGERLQVFAE